MQFDIIIVGGGMVGLSMALALQKSAYQVALLDASPLHAEEDARLIALNDNSIQLFKYLGVWQILHPHASAIQSLHVSKRGSFGNVYFKASDVKKDALGYVVPAKYINEALFILCNDQKNLKLFRPAMLKEIVQEKDQVTLTKESGEKIKAKIVIGVDGTYSTVREKLHFETKEIDYKQSALVTVTELKRHHENRAYERFLKDGAIAMLPLLHNKAATIWTASTDKINDLMQREESDFLKILQSEFGYRLGRFGSVGKRALYPLKMLSVKKPIQNNVILLGNAAHTLHPIAAQGLNLALYEVVMLSSFLLQQKADTLTLEGCDFHSSQQAFSRRLSHCLVELFSHDGWIENNIQRIGMIGLNVFTPLKKQFLEWAMGRSGRLPSLLLSDE